MRIEDYKRRVAPVVLFVVLSQTSASLSLAQLASPAPKTNLEALGLKSGVVILQGLSQVGQMIGHNGSSVVVSATETTEVRTGAKLYGAVVRVREGGGSLDRIQTSFVDYDELSNIAAALDYLAKVDESSTKLDKYYAEYRTKGDLKISVFSDGLSGKALSVTSGTIVVVAASLRGEDLIKLREGFTNAKAKLDSIK